MVLHPRRCRGKHAGAEHVSRKQSSPGPVLLRPSHRIRLLHACGSLCSASVACLGAGEWWDKWPSCASSYGTRGRWHAQPPVCLTFPCTTMPVACSTGRLPGAATSVRGAAKTCCRRSGALCGGGGSGRCRQEAVQRLSPGPTDVHSSCGTRLHPEMAQRCAVERGPARPAVVAAWGAACRPWAPANCLIQHCHGHRAWLQPGWGPLACC